MLAVRVITANIFMVTCDSDLLQIVRRILSLRIIPFGQHTPLQHTHMFNAIIPTSFYDNHFSAVNFTIVYHLTDKLS